ncbi:MAG: ATP-binding cassette domain-containing protein [Chitinivibrionales bacterium]|nr:ATP-binding cassette domain-containing protein [Chitinivibrionales bacterium]MBD3357868.1 ATP-binding cassette domain-containing protein [Chitinivibrionales bacterium]
MQEALTASGITKSFGTRPVLKGLDLTLEPGTVYGLVGLNGAGKTTLIRLLLGLLYPDSGSVTILDRHPGPQTSDLYRSMGVVLEHEGFAGNLSVAQNLRFYARAKGIAKTDFERYFEKYWAQTSIADTSRKAKHLSRGQKMQCALCRAFLGDPRVCLFDEPVVALDVTAYDHFCGMIREARERGAAILISSHQLEAIEELCDRVGILEEGVLSPIRENAGPVSGVAWLIRAPENTLFGEVIQKNVGHQPVHIDGVWEFRIDGEPEIVIPELVSALVEAGCPIEEVRPSTGGIRNSLRDRFRAANRKRLSEEP